MEVSTVIFVSYINVKYLGTILLGAASTPDDDLIHCKANNSLFTLIGNPGIILHPLSGQCIQITKIGEKIGRTNIDDPGNVFLFSFFLCKSVKKRDLFL
jgi:hypothetical protein